MTGVQTCALPILNGNKVLLLSKSNQVDFLVQNNEELKKKIIMSFTLNAAPVSEKWEKGAPSVTERIKAAQKVSEAGFIMRIRIDPMVPVQNWEKHYKKLIDDVFNGFIPERITLGSLRGLQSTINLAKDKSWVPYMTEKSNWGKKIPIEKRIEMYSMLRNYLKEHYNFDKIALCKETVEAWEKLDMNYKKIKCNCIV